MKIKRNKIKYEMYDLAYFSMNGDGNSKCLKPFSERFLYTYRKKIGLNLNKLKRISIAKIYFHGLRC